MLCSYTGLSNSVTLFWYLSFLSCWKQALYLQFLFTHVQGVPKMTQLVFIRNWSNLYHI